MALTSEGELMVQAARDFAEQEIRPVVESQLEKDIFPMEVFRKMNDLEFHKIALPAEEGGLGMGLTTALAVEKEIAKENMTLAMIGTNSAVASLLIRMGTPEQKEKYLPAALKAPCGFAFTEPGAGSDASAITSTAVKDGDEWVINGQKSFITALGVAEYFLVSALTKETDKGGISAFLIPANAEGFEIGEHCHKIGLRGSNTAELYLNDVRVPADALIGKENHGLQASLSLLDEARMGIAACAVGLSERAIEEANTFVRDRIAFGKPLITKQGLQWYLAEMATKTDAARALLLDTAQQYDEGKNITVQAAKTKLFASKVAQEVTGYAVQMCGGYGLTEDLGVERLFRDAKCCSIIEGTDEVLKIVVSRAFK